MIFIIIILVFIIYYFNNNKEYFTYNNIYRQKFLEYIDNINSNNSSTNNYIVNIISTHNKKYFELGLENIGFNKLIPDNNTNFLFKKLNQNNIISIMNTKNLYLSYKYDNNEISYKILNLEKNNKFYLENIENNFFQIDYNKFRFTATIRFNDRYLGQNGFSLNPERLFFNIKIIL